MSNPDFFEEPVFSSLANVCNYYTASGMGCQSTLNFGGSSHRVILKRGRWLFSAAR
jgi:hypothetical protein